MEITSSNPTKSLTLFSTENPMIAFQTLLLLDSLTDGFWDLQHCTQFEANWLKKSFTMLKENLQKNFGIELIYQGTPVMAKGDLDGATKTLEKYFQTPDYIDFGAVVKEVGSSICKIVCEKFDQISEEKKQNLVDFKIYPICPFGMPEYEITFAAQTKFKTQHQLYYPDYNNFTEQHFDLI